VVDFKTQEYRGRSKADSDTITQGSGVSGGRKFTKQAQGWKSGGGRRYSEQPTQGGNREILTHITQGEVTLQTTHGGNREAGFKTL
jgi:hypothetical protein